jgi:hypothetical protein
MSRDRSENYFPQDFRPSFELMALEVLLQSVLKYHYKDVLEDEQNIKLVTCFSLSPIDLRC